MLTANSVPKCNANVFASSAGDFQIHPNFLIDDGLLNRRFVLFLQPQLDLSTGRLVGAESLIRYRSSTGELLTPNWFIEHAEKTGKILDIGHRVQELATDILLEHSPVNKPAWHVALNMSVCELLSGAAFDRLISLMDEKSIDPENIHVEITESALIEDPSTVTRQLQQIKSIGCEVWLDDFGTGYSSLSMLSQLDIDGLKIDKSFVDRIQHDDRGFTLCSAIIAMAQRLGLAVVAEGIENEDQLLTLAQLGCDRGQGYLLGKPMPVDAFIKHWHLN